MKNTLSLIVLTSLLLGCTSSPSINNNERFQSITGGQTLKGMASLYWYTEQLELPYSAADFVSFNDKSWYQSDYQWRGSAVREIIREGEKRASSKLVPYKIHLRFSENEEAVYQQYRLDGKVLPMTQQEIASLQNQVTEIKNITKKQYRNNSRLIQGYWNAGVFSDCSGREYQNIKFHYTLPDSVVNQLSTQDSYTAFIGSGTTKLVVKQLLLLKNQDYDCITRPVFIEEK